MGKLTDWRMAYLAARVGTAIWLLVRSLPELLLWVSTPWNFQVNVFFLGSQVLFIAGLLAGITMLLGFKTKIAAFVATLVAFTIGNAGMAAICIGLVGFASYDPRASQ